MNILVNFLKQTYTRYRKWRRKRRFARGGTLYWLSAIIQDYPEKKPYLLAVSDGDLRISETFKMLTELRKTRRVLSAWIDKSDRNGETTTVFHECYIDVFGYLEKPDGSWE